MTPDGNEIHGTADEAMAKRLKEYLFEPVDVTLSGVGKWAREASRWTLLEFWVTDVQEVDFSGVEDYLQRIQGSGTGWDDFDDPVAELLAMRHVE
ncbi:MAG: hypothetical protein LBF61_12565 [Azoarcus sp.]|nr:hypothetical protein [Azoarcus sp.]